ncbi:MAG: ABC transporter substrate-binding protein [Kiritimatiellae bacterium]|nr:ABC transporter substrate-binding protein [Kiritimatiellia bacterium]
MSKLESRFPAALSLLLAAGLLAWCGCGRKGEAPGEQPGKKKGFVIGVSNGWVGSEWRSQMVDDVLAAAEPYKEAGLIEKVVVQSTDVDIPGQIGQVKNFINMGVDAILINPNAQAPFNPVINEAKRAGIIVVATDQEVTSPDAVNVVIDQREWAQISARWLAEKLNHKGNIVCINGMAGHPANEARVRGYHDVFDKHPGIKILNETNANWDQALGQQVASTLLATYPALNGIWVQDGMSEGALRAVQAANRKDIIITGEARVGYMKLWKEAGIDGIGVANPPGCMTSALRVALQLLQGRTVDPAQLKGEHGNTLYVPVPGVVTNENFDEYFERTQDKPDYYAIDGSITDEQAAAFFL